jgi:valyl-tRNA synthetase
VTVNLDNYDLGVALAKIYSFLWEEFCDWYIEMAKARLNDGGSRGRLVAQSVLNQVLVEALRLLHPFMPFVTEAIQGHLIQDSESIMVSEWPKADAALVFPDDERQMAVLMDAIREIRNVRTNMNVPPSRKAGIIVVAHDATIRAIFESSLPFLQRLASVQSLQTQADKANIPPTAVTAIFSAGEIFIPLTDLIDLGKEIERLEKEKTNLEQEVARVSSKLENAEFVAKAPAKVIDVEREKITRYQAMLASANERLAQLRQL